MEELNNPFWKDLLRSWIMFCNAAKIQTLEDVYFLLYGIIQIFNMQNIFIIKIGIIRV